MKKITFLLLVTSFFSACESTNLLNGEKKYIINTECGRVQLTSTRLEATGVHLKVKPLDGNLEINSDSTILKYPISEDFLYNRVYYCINFVKKENLKSPLLLRKGKVLLYRMYIYMPINGVEEFRKEYNKIYIAPNDFILCNGKPVITDTIRISRPPLPRRNSKP